MLAKFQKLRGPLLIVSILYGVELIDELIYGLHGAVVPYFKTDFNLTYTQIGLLFTLPGIFALLIEPLIGLIGDTRHRRWLVVGGLAVTVLGLALIGTAQIYGVILVAFCIMSPASGAYVNLAQATLIDSKPTRAEQTMARWVLLGSIGVAISPLALMAVFSIGLSWRSVYLALAIIAAAYLLLLLKPKFDAHAGAAEESITLRQMKLNLVEALRNRTLMKWVILTELADLMLDKLLEQVGLYFHDVARVTLAEATGAVSIFTAGWLIGNIALVPLLERVPGIRILRITSLIVSIAYAALLLVPIVWIKYVLLGVMSLSTASWYVILRAKTYEALPGRSGVVIAVTAIFGAINLFVPVILGGIADAIGLQAAMGLLLIGPVALTIGVRSK